MPRVFGTTKGGGRPGGSTTQVQYNNGGAFGADSGFTRNPSTGETHIQKTIATNTVAEYSLGDLSLTAFGITFPGSFLSSLDGLSNAQAIVGVGDLTSIGHGTNQMIVAVTDGSQVSSIIVSSVGTEFDQKVSIGNGTSLTEALNINGNIEMFATGFFIGNPGSSAGGTRATAIGFNVVSSGDSATAIGDGATASGLNSLSLGVGSLASAEDAVALGKSAAATVVNAVAIGIDSFAHASSAIAIGSDAEASADRAIAIGNSAKAAFANSIAIGDGSLTTSADEMQVGASGTPMALVTYGTTTFNTVVYTWPSSDGLSGDVLTTDASGNLTWETPTASSPGGMNTQVQFNSSSSFGGSANLTWVSPALTIGKAGTATGQLKLAGATSGTVTIQGAAAAGTWSLTLPTSSGSSGQFLQTNGSGTTVWATPTAAPAGSNTQVQFNDSGSLAGDAGFTYDKSTDTITLAGNIIMPAQFFIGNGSANSGSIVLGTGIAYNTSFSVLGGTAGTVGGAGHSTAILGSAAADDAVSIGLFSSANFTNAIAIGRAAQALASNTFAIGYNTEVDDALGGVLGYQASSKNGGFGIGTSASAYGLSSTVIGNNSSTGTSADYSVMIGTGCTANVAKNALIGYGVSSTGALSIGIGVEAVIGHNYSMAFGIQATTSATAQAMFGSSGFPATIYNYGGLRVNIGGGDYDSQIQGDTDQYLTYWDASVDRVGFGTNTPKSGVDIKKSLGLNRTTVNDTSYTIADTDLVVAFIALTSARTVTLPAAATAGERRTYVVKDEVGNAATWNITIDGNGSEKIDGSLTKVISTNYGSVTLYCDGANWFTI